MHALALHPARPQSATFADRARMELLPTSSSASKTTTHLEPHSKTSSKAGGSGQGRQAGLIYHNHPGTIKPQLTGDLLDALIAEAEGKLLGTQTPDPNPGAAGGAAVGAALAAPVAVPVAAPGSPTHALVTDPASPTFGLLSG